MSGDASPAYATAARGGHPTEWITMGKKQKPPRDPLEKHYPSPRGRAAADAAIDALPVTEPMSTFLDAWDEAYFRATGHSPFRP